MLPYHQRWRIVGKSLKWKWVWCYDVNCRGKWWVMYLMLHLKSQWGSYLLNRVINAIYYLCLSKWRNEIRRWWRQLAICRNTALACKLHYYSFFVCNICIISPQITALFVSMQNFSFGKAVSQFPFSGALIKVSRQLFHAYFHAVVLHLYRSNVVFALLGIYYCIHGNKTRNHHR